MSYKFSSICLKCSLLGVFLLLLQVSFSQKKQDYASPKYNWDYVNRQLQAKQKLLGTDVVMMIWKKDDSLLYKKELGEFTSKTQAPIGNSSQWLTAALVMVFVDEGKISLDDKITKWIPEYAKYGKNYITIRNCLSHMTGIEDEGGFKKIFQRKKFASLEEEVNSFAARDIRANPSTDFWYGNIGMNIAGRVLEIMSKKRFDVLIKQKLFTPLAMRRTSFTSLDGGPVSPSDGALSTPEDYMKFLVMLLNKGKSETGQQIITEESINTLLTIQTKPSIIKFAPKAGEGYNYALGSWVIEEKTNKAIAFANPSLSGTWPIIDLCRGYAYLLFVKNPSDEQPKAAEYLRIKEMVDELMPANCN